MPTLPGDLTFGYVVGLFLLGVADTADVGRLPDPKAAVGLISFDSSSPIEKTTSPSAFVGKQKVDCSIDANGYLVDPMGAQGVWLFAGVWKVTYNIVGLAIQSHDIEVLTSHTELAPLDLVQALPAGTPIDPTQYAELSARISALEMNNQIVASPVASPPPPTEGLIWVQY